MKLDYTADIYGIVTDGAEYVRTHFAPIVDNPCFLPGTHGKCQNPTCHDILWADGKPYCGKAVKT